MLTNEECLKVSQDLADRITLECGTSAVGVLADALCEVLAGVVVGTMPIEGAEAVLMAILTAVRADASSHPGAPTH